MRYLLSAMLVALPSLLSAQWIEWKLLDTARIRTAAIDSGFAAVDRYIVYHHPPASDGFRLYDWSVIPPKAIVYQPDSLLVAMPEPPYDFRDTVVYRTKLKDGVSIIGQSSYRGFDLYIRPKFLRLWQAVLDPFGEELRGYRGDLILPYAHRFSSGGNDAEVRSLVEHYMEKSSANLLLVSIYDASTADREHLQNLVFFWQQHAAANKIPFALYTRSYTIEDSGKEYSVTETMDVSHLLFEYGFSFRSGKFGMELRQVRLLTGTDGGQPNERGLEVRGIPYYQAGIISARQLEAFVTDPMLSASLRQAVFSAFLEQGIVLPFWGKVPSR